MHVFRHRREEDRRLARRVATTNDRDVFVLAELRFHEGGAVVHAGILEFADPRQVRLSVLRTGRDDDRASADALATVDLDRIRTPLTQQPSGVPGDDEARTELLRLIPRASREFLA